jgi:Restriction endonuclease NotI
MLIAEIFGRSITDVSAGATTIREAKLCPFRGTPCTKTSKSDPLGVCSLQSGQLAAAICPVRFLDENRIFQDAARIAFGSDAEFSVFPEVRILRIPNDGADREKKIGKVDFVLGRIENGSVTNFAALEVQASYFSGNSIRPALNYFLENKAINPAISDRRPDFRSSAQKRLMPQLQLKVPVFRRWGKKFFVVVDSLFFRELPVMKTTSISNSEIIWLNYAIELQSNAFRMRDPLVAGTTWDEVVNSLREGIAPEPQEIISELQRKIDVNGKSKPRLFRVT